MESSFHPCSKDPNEPDVYICLDVLDGAKYNVSNTGQLGNNTSDTTLPESRWQVLFLLLVILAGIIGNLLVVIAVYMERRLRNVTNYFLVSLAVADLLVSIIVMPANIIHEYNGYWPFDLILCDLWQVFDVMMCTSSIMHMCSISLDRYMAIHNPLKVRNKSCSIVIIKIIIVWLISLVIASPIIILSVLDPKNVLHNRNCAIFNKYFLIYGSLAAFFIPLVIMLIAYSLTIYILQKQARLCEAKTKAGGPIMRRSTTCRKKKGIMKGLADMQTMNGVNFAQGFKAFDRANNRASETEPLHRRQNRRGRTMNRHDMVMSSRGILRLEDESPVQSNPPTSSKSAICDMSRSSHWSRLHAEHPSNSPIDSVESREPAPASSERRPSPKLQLLVRKHSAAIKAASSMIQMRNEHLHKKELNTVKTEKKAVKVLGTMFALFVICWAPFFSLNFAMGMCNDCEIDMIIFKIFLWLGYISSTLNPIIYTVFNKTFKKTFIRILTCQLWCKRCRRWRKRLTYTMTNGHSVRFRYESPGPHTIESAL